MNALFRFEKQSDPLAPRAKFRSRLMTNVSTGALVVIVALAIGMSGYSYFEGMSAIDAFANSAMILSGMGPLAPLLTFGGKLFAGIYAIFCGLLIFAIAGLILAPVFHRILHRFHVSESSREK